VVSDVHPPRELMLSLGVLSSEFVALHLPEIHDEIHRQITICYED